MESDIQLLWVQDAVLRGMKSVLSEVQDVKTGLGAIDCDVLRLLQDLGNLDIVPDALSHHPQGAV